MNRYINLSLAGLLVLVLLIERSCCYLHFLSLASSAQLASWLCFKPERRNTIKRGAETETVSNLAWRCVSDTCPAGMWELIWLPFLVMGATVGGCCQSHSGRPKPPRRVPGFEANLSVGQTIYFQYHGVHWGPKDFSWIDKKRLCNGGCGFFFFF